MYRYRAFGLSFSSDVRLDELEEETDTQRQIDVEIRKTQIGFPIPPLGGPQHIDFEDPEGVLMVWSGAAGVRIQGPGRIEIEPYPDVPENYLAFPLLGPVMGWLLHMRGLMVLHASTVVHCGTAITFLGDKTAGKSTTATAFLAAGAKLLTDDLLALQFNQDMLCRALPAFAQFKLNSTGPEAPAAIKAQKLPLIVEGFEKHQYRLSELQAIPVPPGLIFVLERSGTVPEIEWMEDREALAALLRYAYNVRFSTAPVEQQERARQFRQAVALLNQSRVGTLRIPHTLDRLPEVVDLIEAKLSESCH